ncbi:MAG: hypothetical protein ACRD8U_05635, partial [Pyrinomonadaceae bacterium]
MKLVRLLPSLYLVGFLLNTAVQTTGQTRSRQPRQVALTEQVPTSLALQIVQAEDERRWDTELIGLLSNKNPAVRRRAALAAGRVGDERAVPS